MSDSTGRPQDIASPSGTEAEEPSEAPAPWEVGRKNPPPQDPASVHYAPGQGAPPAGYGAAPPQAPYGAPAGQQPPYPGGYTPNQQPGAYPPQRQPPYGGYPPGQAPYGQQQPYGQAPYGQQPYGQPSYRPAVATPASVNERNAALFKWLGPAIGAVIMIGFLCYEFIAPTVGPATLSRFVSPDQRYSVMAPADWSKSVQALDPTSDSKAAGALFVDGPAKIDITTDDIVALRAHDLLTSNGPVPDSVTGDPLPVLHKMYTNRLSPMKDYQEQPAQNVQTNLGPAEISEFTCEGGEFGLGGPTHGYQASIISGDTTYEVVAQCNEKSWSGLQPMFMQVIKSMAPPDGKAVSSDLDLDSGSQGSGSSAPASSGPPPIAPPPPDDTGTDTSTDDSQ